MTVIGPVGTPATGSKQEVIFVSDWLRQGGGGGEAADVYCCLVFYSFHQQLIQLCSNISKVEIIYVLWYKMCMHAHELCQHADEERREGRGGEGDSR